MASRSDVILGRFFMAVLAVGLCVAIYLVATEPTRAEQANTACRTHGGVADIHSRQIVVCKDGFAKEID